MKTLTKKEFIKKYSQHYQLLKDKFVNKDKELESDIDMVIKDEIEKFAKYWNTTDSYLITKEYIKTYLNTKP